MGKKLNQISDEIVQENIANYLRRRGKLVAPTSESAPAEQMRYFLKAADHALEIGLAQYQQEAESSSIVAELRDAGAKLIRGISLRAAPVDDKLDYRNPWQMEKALNLLVCFCAAEEREIASKVEERQYRFPRHPEHDMFGR